MTTRQDRSAAVVFAPSFVSVMSGEWFKLRTMQSTWWLLATFVLLTAAMGATSSVGGSDPSADDLTQRLAAGLSFTVVLPAVLGAVAATSEWSTGIVRVSLVATPSRARWVLTKAAVVALVTGAATLIAMALTVAFSMLRYAGSNTGLDLSDPDVLTVVLGAPVFVAVMAVLSVAIGVLLRHSGGAVTTAVALLFFAPLIVPVFGLPILIRLLPTSTGPAFMGLPASLSPGVAIAVTLAWAAIPLALSIPALVRRGA